jgi:protein TonB
VTRVLTSPLGDLAIPRADRSHWLVAAALAVAAHALGAAAYWTWAPEPDATVEDDVMIGVELGPPGGRIEDPPPPPPPQATPQPPQPPTALTERAPDAPPVEYTPPPPPAPPGARLSSGSGVGDGVAPAPPPPPPPPEPQFDRARLQAYANQAAQLIYERIEYPARARDGRVEGLASLRILVDRRGNLLDSELVSGTGNTLLDQSIVRAVQRVDRFPPIPQDFPVERLRVIVSIRFILFEE